MASGNSDGRGEYDTVRINADDPDTHGRDYYGTRTHKCYGMAFSLFLFLYLYLTLQCGHVIAVCPMFACFVSPHALSFVFCLFLRVCVCVCGHVRAYLNKPGYYFMLSAARWVALFTALLVLSVPMTAKITDYYRAETKICQTCLEHARADTSNFYEFAECSNIQSLEVH
jgi:hypothetical protein